jgi:hypothetical protein
MNNRSPELGDCAHRRLGPLDATRRATGSIAFLLAVALTAVSFGSLIAITADSALPSPSRAAAGPSVILKTEQSATGPLVAMAPTKPNAAVTGW